MLQASNFQASQFFPGSRAQRQLSFKLDQHDGERCLLHTSYNHLRAAGP